MCVSIASCMIHASYLCLMCRLYDPKSISNFCLCMPSMMSCTHFILAKHPRAVCEVNAVSKKETCTNTCLCTLPCQKVTYPYISHPKVGKMRLISSIWWDMHGFLEGIHHHIHHSKKLIQRLRAIRFRWCSRELHLAGYGGVSIRMFLCLLQLHLEITPLVVNMFRKVTVFSPGRCSCRHL